MADFNKLQEEILELKKEKNALILAHYYVPLEVQDIADKVGDSFALAKHAKSTDRELIVMCGVRFMAESAKILNPSKKVLLPAPDAGCPMADMITPEGVMQLRAEHPRAAVMCYVNSSAAVKAVCDVCCTSSSAIKVARSLTEDEIIFVPDAHLGEYTARMVPEKKFYCHNGFCPTHHRITEKDALSARAAHPQALMAVHPECREEVLRHADYIGSTAGILDFARDARAGEIIIGTESGIIERLQRELPEKRFYSVSSSFICPNMKKVSLQSVRDCLKNDQFEIRLTEAEMSAARRSLDRMVNV